MRADQLLVERGLAVSRAQAQRLIAAGVRWRAGLGEVGWRTVRKNGDALPPAAEILLSDAAELRYVSRGGLKLEGALQSAGIQVAGLRCLDVGQSTGGFTDCLLQHDAASVIGVDVGHGQLHARLRADPRVRCIEGVNARTLDAHDLIADNVDTTSAKCGFSSGFELIVGDLSFISLTLVLPGLVPLLAADGALLLLVKPQFELQPAQIGKGGIVRDAALYEQVEQRLRGAAAANGLAVRDWFDSPIRGGDGNREFFLHATRAMSITGAPPTAVQP
ncbi:MAG: RNA binding methyltransferase FtsJ like [Burkholderiaceae bacterium]|jgi:23S rRNA (cytidine1920-2'-O)/16S rRNA (cytidine1409-2'-O)-methyltransferase|nr:MAG: RNA binding methyltransferase FtsJ like [Burkholderiaceae bacterium]